MNPVSFPMYKLQFLIIGRIFEMDNFSMVIQQELIFEDFRIPAENLIGSEENQGFGQVMSGLETGRINVAARAVGVAQAAFEAAIRYSQQRESFGQPISQHQAIQTKLADMATRVEASRLLVEQAARAYDTGERCDLEAGMA